MKIDFDVELYKKAMSDFMTIPANSTVVEIAPGHVANYVEAYRRGSIKKLIAVEPHADWLECLKRSNFGNLETEFVNSTYEEYYPTEKIDVVVCAGLSYHLHSPLHLVETIVNRFSPTIIYFETIGHLIESHYTRIKESIESNPNDLVHIINIKCNFEEINKPGNVCTDEKLKRRIPLNIRLPIAAYPMLFDTVGYALDSYLNYSGERSKRIVSMMKFVPAKI